MGEYRGIGRRITKFRELRDVSLEELAKRTGLDVELLKEIEQDKVYPAIGVLLKISRGLGTRLGTFIDDYISEDPVIVRANEKELESSSYKGNQNILPLKFYSLGRGKTDRHMEPFYIEIYPKKEDMEFSSHEGEEFIVVVSGKIEVVYGKEKYTLEQGDSIYYNSAIPHRVSCVGDEVAKIYAVLYMP